MEEIFSLNNNLFTYNIQAVKELDSKLQQQKPVIDLLKSKLNELLAEALKETI